MRHIHRLKRNFDIGSARTQVKDCRKEIKLTSRDQAGNKSDVCAGTSLNQTWAICPPMMVQHVEQTGSVLCLAPESGGYVQAAELVLAELVLDRAAQQSRQRSACWDTDSRFKAGPVFK